MQAKTSKQADPGWQTDRLEQTRKGILASRQRNLYKVSQVKTRHM
jgi:hypothetical protein